MNTPLNPKHELFAQRVATGESATAAYRAIYETSKNADVFGPRLMGNDGIRARVATLQAASATATTLTMRERRERLATRARSATVKDGDLVAIVLADAKLAGDLVEKVEQKDTTPRESLAELRKRVEEAHARASRS